MIRVTVNGPLREKYVGLLRFYNFVKAIVVGLIYKGIAVNLPGEERPRLQEFLREWSATLYQMPARGVRWHLDVDPIEF